MKKLISIKNQQPIVKTTTQYNICAFVLMDDIVYCHSVRVTDKCVDEWCNQFTVSSILSYLSLVESLQGIIGKCNKCYASSLRSLNKLLKCIWLNIFLSDWSIWKFYYPHVKAIKKEEGLFHIKFILNDFILIFY